MTERHPNSARFHEFLAEAGELHDLKQGDYGRGDDPFSNVRASEEWGISGWKGAMLRLNDKVRRLQSLALKGSLNNEAAVDSFMDIAVYALIARVLFEQDQAGTPLTEHRGLANRKRLGPTAPTHPLIARAQGKKEYVDLGERRDDGTLRPAYERWPNGAPT